MSYVDTRNPSSSFCADVVCRKGPAQSMCIDKYRSQICNCCMNSNQPNCVFNGQDACQSNENTCLQSVCQGQDQRMCMAQRTRELCNCCLDNKSTCTYNVPEGVFNACTGRLVGGAPWVMVTPTPMPMPTQMPVFVRPTFPPRRIRTRR